MQGERGGSRARCVLQRKATRDASDAKDSCRALGVFLVLPSVETQDSQLTLRPALHFTPHFRLLHCTLFPVPEALTLFPSPNLATPPHTHPPQPQQPGGYTGGSQGGGYGGQPYPGGGGGYGPPGGGYPPTQVYGGGGPGGAPGMYGGPGGGGPGGYGGMPPPPPPFGGPPGPGGAGGYGQYGSQGGNGGGGGYRAW